MAKAPQKIKKSGKPQGPATPENLTIWPGEKSIT
jgi:hypothetical protein